MSQPDVKPVNRLSRRNFMRASITSAAALAAARAAMVPGAAAAAEETGAVATLSSSVVDPPAAGSTAPVRPFTLSEVRLGPGLLAEKRDRMLHYARNYDERRMLVVFNTNAGRPNPPGVTAPGGWETTDGLLRGHYAGHFMTLLAQSYADSGEAVFKNKLDWMVQELGACQDAILAGGLSAHAGYLGAVPEDVVLRLGPPRWAVYGSNVNTNTWAPWYVQHKIMRGLLDAYYNTANERALEIALKLGSWTHLALTLGDVRHPNYPGPLTRDDLNYMWDLYIAGEYGGANEAFPELYALSGDARYLETAKLFDNRESLFDACMENRDILVLTNQTNPGRRRPNRLHANSHVPNFPGYLRIYEQTGEEDYFLAAKNFFWMVAGHRTYVNGGTSGNYPGSNNNIEMFQNRNNIANSIAEGGSETCTTYNMIKLARNLFFHEQDPAYMDFYERGLVNQIAGSRSDTNSTANPQVTYFQPLTPGAQKGAFGNTGTCCGGTGMENHTKYQESIYFRAADGSALYVNLYQSSTLEWEERGFTVTQETDYPRNDRVRLTVDGSGALELRLRVPAWVEKGFHVTINGAAQDLEAVPGTYLSIARTWSPGDTLEISMPFSIRIERAMDRPDTQAIFWGPVLLPILGNPGGGSYRELTLYHFLKRDGDYARAAVTPAGGINFTTHGYTLQPWYVGERPAQSPYFRRVEPDVVFGSVSAGVPNRKRNDGLPNYDVPVAGIPSPGTDGPTFLDVLWDQAPFRTHGQFVAAVTQTAEAFEGLGIYSAAERAAIVSAAARARLDMEPLEPRAELDALVAAGGITPSLEAKIRHALDMYEEWILEPRKLGPALSHLDRAARLLEWQADVVDRTGLPQGDPAGLRALAATIREMLETNRD